MTAFEMYLFTRIDRIHCAIGTLGGLTMVALCVAVCVYLMVRFNNDLYDEDYIKTARKTLIISASIAIPLQFVWAAIPTQKELAAIWVAPKLLSSENVDKLTKVGENGIDLLQLTTEYMKETLKEKGK